MRERERKREKDGKVAPHLFHQQGQEAAEHNPPTPTRFIIARLLLFVAGDLADVSDKVASSQWLGRYCTDNYLMTTK